MYISFERIDESGGIYAFFYGIPLSFLAARVLGAEASTQVPILSQKEDIYETGDHRLK